MPSVETWISSSQYICKSFKSFAHGTELIQKWFIWSKNYKASQHRNIANHLIVQITVTKSHQTFLSVDYWAWPLCCLTAAAAMLRGNLFCRLNLKKDHTLLLQIVPKFVFDCAAQCHAKRFCSSCGGTGGSMLFPIMLCFLSIARRPNKLGGANWRSTQQRPRRSMTN